MTNVSSNKLPTHSSSNNEVSFGASSLASKEMLEGALSNEALEGIENADPATVLRNIALQDRSFEVALELGKCQLTKLELGEEGGLLTPQMAYAAALSGLAKINDGRNRVSVLDSDFANKGIDTNEAPFVFLELIFENWAARFAVQETMNALMDSDDDALRITWFSLIEDVDDSWADALIALDIELDARRDKLCVVCKTQLITNWRPVLWPQNGSSLLDGSLEKSWKKLSAHLGTL